jgi:hypothetical protein
MAFLVDVRRVIVVRHAGRVERVDTSLTAPGAGRDGMWATKGVCGACADKADKVREHLRRADS